MKKVHQIKTISLILMIVLFSCLAIGCNSDKSEKQPEKVPSENMMLSLKITVTKQLIPFLSTYNI